MEIAPHISVDLSIHHGAAVIAGTRAPASIVVGSLAAGMSTEDVMREYELAKEQVAAALAFAADLVSESAVTPSPEG